MNRKNSSRKVVVIGVDGADWRLINPWIKDGHLKHLNEIINKGAQGILTSTIPPFTLPSWTSIFTGVNPGKHGIADNLIRVGDKIRPGLSTYRKAPLLWKLLGYSGMKSIVVNDPVTYPPEPINGIMVTGFLTPPDSDSYTYPPEIKDEVDKASGGYMPELPLDYDKLIAHDKKEAYDFVQRFAQKTADSALYLMRNHEWDVFDVTFTSTDRLQHFYWHDKDILREHYVWLDSIIGKLVDLASNDEAEIIVVSDHGFAPVHKSVHVNTILAEEGLIQIRSSKLRLAMNKVGLTSESLTNLLQHMKLLDITSKLMPQRLKQTLPSKNSKSISGRPIAKLSSAAGIFIERKLCDDYEAVRSLIIRSLSSLRDGDKNVMAGVHKPEEVLWGPLTSRAPDLLVIPNEGYYLSTAIKDSVLSEAIQPGSGIRRTGEHRMQGIFIAYGPSIKHTRDLNLHTWDIAPTILHFLALPVPRYMDGTIAKSIFRDGSDPATRRVVYSRIRAGARGREQSCARRVLKS